jgi:hypothetical protein
MNFLSTITKSLRRLLRIHPPAELFPLSKEKARRPHRGYQEVWSDAACPTSALRSEGISSVKRSQLPPRRLRSGNCDRAARVTTALLHIILSSSTPPSGLRQHVEELLRDEFADIKRQAAADRADVNA